MSEIRLQPGDLDSLRRAVAYGKENGHHRLIVRLSVLEALLAAEGKARCLDIILDAVESLCPHDGEANPTVEALLDWVRRAKNAEAEVARLRAVVADTLPVMETAVRAGLDGWSREEEDAIVAGHVTVAKLRAALRGEG